MNEDRLEILAELVSIFVNNIAPVLIVAGVGYIAGKRLKVDAQSIGLLIFNVFSPALVFFSLYDSKIGGHELVLLLLLTALFQLSMAGLGYVVMKFYGVERLERASVILSTFCLNGGNYGLSIANFAFGEAVLARAVVVYIGNTALNYTLGVFVASSGHLGPRSALLTILRVPAFYATITAFLLRGLNIELPTVLFRSITVLKDAAIPAMLVLLGLQLSQAAPVYRWKLVSIGVILKLLIGPLLGTVLAFLFHLNGVAAVAFILQTAMPTAVVTLVLAKQYQLDETLSLNLIVASTLLSPFTLSVIILLLRNSWPL
jgi:malate permease and related proteins